MKKMLCLIGLTSLFFPVLVHALPGTLVTLVDQNGNKMGVVALPVTVTGNVTVTVGTGGAFLGVSGVAFDQTRTYAESVSWSASVAPATPNAYRQFPEIYGFAYGSTLNARYTAQVPLNITYTFALTPTATESFFFLSPTAGSAILNLCNLTAYGTPGNIIYGFSNTSANIGLSAATPAVGSVLISGACTGDIQVPGTYGHYINANSCTPTARYDATAPFNTGTVKPTTPPF